jgi:hypothetical protein
MKTSSSPPVNTKETCSRTTETANASHRTSRPSHISISSNKRSSVNTGGTNPSKIKQGMFHRAVPQMPRALAFFCFVLNLILPGTGMNTLQYKKKNRSICIGFI